MGRLIIVRFSIRYNHPLRFTVALWVYPAPVGRYVSIPSDVGAV